MEKADFKQQFICWESATRLVDCSSCSSVHVSRLMFLRCEIHCHLMKVKVNFNSFVMLKLKYSIQNIGKCSLLPFTNATVVRKPLELHNLLLTSQLTPNYTAWWRWELCMYSFSQGSLSWNLLITVQYKNWNPGYSPAKGANVVSKTDVHIAC